MGEMECCNPSVNELTLRPFSEHVCGDQFTDEVFTCSRPAMQGQHQWFLWVLVSHMRFHNSGDGFDCNVLSMHLFLKDISEWSPAWIRMSVRTNPCARMHQQHITAAFVENAITPIGHISRHTSNYSEVDETALNAREIKGEENQGKSEVLKAHHFGSGTLVAMCGHFTRHKTCRAKQLVYKGRVTLIIRILELTFCNVRFSWLICSPRKPTFRTFHKKITFPYNLLETLSWKDYGKQNSTVRKLPVCYEANDAREAWQMFIKLPRSGYMDLQCRLDIIDKFK